MKSTFIKSILLALMLIFTGCSLDGTITNENGEAIYNAKVTATYATDLTKEIQSDENGNYHFEFDSATVVSVNVSKTGYSSQSKSVEIASNGSDLDFMLTSNGEEKPFEITAIKGKIVDTNANPLKGNVKIKGNKYSKTVSESGIIYLTKSNTEEVFFDYDKPVTLEFTLYTSSKNSITFDKTYEASKFLDVNDSSVMNIGDVVVEVGKVKGCAKTLLNTRFGLFKYSNKNDGSGISLDNRFNSNPKEILDADDGLFEFDIYKDNKEHTLTLTDAYGNTKTSTFMADSDLIDLSDECIRVEIEKRSDIDIMLTIDSEHTISGASIKNEDDEDIKAYTHTSPTSGSFTLDRNGVYAVTLTSNKPYVEDPEDTWAFFSDHINYTISYDDIDKNASTILTAPSEEGFLTFYAFVGIYQGEVFLLDLFY